MKSSLIVCSLLLGSVPFSFSAVTKAEPKQLATFTQIDGKTQLFTNPSKTAYAEKSLKKGTMAFFEGDYYLIQDAKVSDQIPRGSIVRTLPNAHARIVYENGDQFYVGPGTSYRVTWNDKTDLDTSVQLLYGRLRGVIAKEGPRKEIRLRTKAATLGVRGTDFFVADSDAKNETEITVLRGAVEVTPNSGKNKSTPTLVKTGMSATVIFNEELKDKPIKLDPTVELRDTTKEDLTTIQTVSTLTESVPASDRIARLEKKAIDVTLEDIKRYQPEFFKQIDPAKAESLQELNSKMVTLSQNEAPTAPKKHKPNITELKETDEDDVYDKYFKIGE